MRYAFVGCSRIDQTAEASGREFRIVANFRRDKDDRPVISGELVPAARYWSTYLGVILISFLLLHARRRGTSSTCHLGQKRNELLASV